MQQVSAEATKACRPVLRGEGVVCSDRRPLLALAQVTSTVSLHDERILSLAKLIKVMQAMAEENAAQVRRSVSDCQRRVMCDACGPRHDPLHMPTTHSPACPEHSVAALGTAHRSLVCARPISSSAVCPATAGGPVSVHRGLEDSVRIAASADAAALPAPPRDGVDDELERRIDAKLKAWAEEQARTISHRHKRVPHDGAHARNMSCRRCAASADDVGEAAGACGRAAAAAARGGAGRPDPHLGPRAHAGGRGRGRGRGGWGGEGGAAGRGREDRGAKAVALSDLHAFLGAYKTLVIRLRLSHFRTIACT